MQKLIVLLTLLLFPVLAYAQGFGSPNGVGFPTSGSSSGGGLTSPVAVADGGTGLTSYTAGDTVYYLSGTTFSKLAKGTALQYYRMNAGATAPEWATLPASGGFTYSAKTSSFSAATGNAYGVDSSGGAVVCTLPTAVGVAGQEIVVSLQVAGNNLTFNTTSAQTIDGQASGAIITGVRYNSYRFMSNGTNWMML